MWWGGYAWGPRFLVALSPLVALAALPALGRACGGSKGWRTAALVAVTAALAVQVLGVTVHFGIYESELFTTFGASDETPLLYRHGSAALYDPARSPIVAHARILAESGVSDIVWLAGEVDWAALAVLGFAAAVLGWRLVRALRRPPARSRRWPVLAAGVLLVIVTAWAMTRSTAGPIEAAYLPDPALDLIAAEAQDGDGVLLYVPELTKSVLNNYPGFPPAWGMPPLVPADGDLEAALSRAQQQSKRLWVVSWFDRTDPNAWAEARLAAAHYAIGRRQAEPGGYWIGQYVIYGGDEDWQPAGWTLEQGIRLDGCAAAQTGDTLLLALRWEALADIGGDYVIFVHVLGADGELVAQADHAPQNGFRPTWTWQTGDTVIDRVAVTLPAGAGAYTVRVGMYDWREPGVRFTGEMPDGAVTDSFEIAHVARQEP
jgi:hypothetical protein